MSRRRENNIDNTNTDHAGRRRFYGIYSGKVEDNKDPLKKGRVKLKVHQTTGQQITGWAPSCTPISSLANHPDHAEHTAAQIAALLTTTPVSVTDSRGDTETVPALTVVAKSGAGTLKHPHKTAVNATNKWNESSGTVYNDATTTQEHTPHRIAAKIGQLVWVMYIAGDPEFPVWIGVQ